MDTYRKPSAPASETAGDAYKPSGPAPKGILDRIFSTNWGLAVICGLVAIGICVAALHSSHAESRAEEVPVAGVETSVSELPDA